MLAAMLAVVFVAALLPSLAVASTRPISFSIDLGWWCVDGRASDGASVTVVWTDDESVVKQRGSVRSNAKGYWVLCGDTDEDVEPGDTVSARVGTITRKVTVPVLTVIPDRGPDQNVTGRGPADTTLSWSRCYRRSAEPVRYWNGAAGHERGGRQRLERGVRLHDTRPARRRPRDGHVPSPDGRQLRKSAACPIHPRGDWQGAVRRLVPGVAQALRRAVVERRAEGGVVLLGPTSGLAVDLARSSVALRTMTVSPSAFALMTVSSSRGSARMPTFSCRPSRSRRGARPMSSPEPAA